MNSEMEITLALLHMDKVEVEKRTLYSGMITGKKNNILNYKELQILKRKNLKWVVSKEQLNTFYRNPKQSS